MRSRLLTREHIRARFRIVALSPYFRGSVHACVVMIAMVGEVPVRASTIDSLVDYDIDAGPADRTLVEYAQQSSERRLSVLFPTDVLSQFTTNPLHGQYRADEALNALLRDTGLSGSISAVGVVTIIKTREGDSTMNATRSPLRWIGGLLLASTALAQSPDPSPNAIALEEIVITGSRLQSGGFNAPTPVTVVNAETIQQRAPANVADVINEQPAFRISQSDTTRNNGGNGGFPNSAQALLDLRALGPTRTLTLINGHRAVGTNWQGTVDTNIVPVGLVERIEVVTGGASAAYGSDAVAGVANIILREKMQGITATVQTGYTEYGSGKQYTANLAGGTSFAADRGHFIIGVDYDKSDAIKDSYGKKWGANEITTIQPSAAQRIALGLPQNVIANNVEPGTSAPGGLLYQGTVGGRAYTFDAAGNPVLFNQGTVWGSGQNMTGSTANYGYNTGNVAWLRIPTKRIDVYGRASFDLTENLTSYLEVNDAHNTVSPYKANDIITAVGAGGTTPAIAISRTNPFVTPAIQALLSPGTAPFSIGRINTEIGLGGTWTSQDIDTYRVVAGLKGAFLETWKWDAYYQAGRTRLDFNRNDLNMLALQKAVNNCADTSTAAGQVGFGTGTTLAANQASLAAYESISGLTCAPFNPFGVGRNAASATNYFNWPTEQIEHLAQDVVAATLSGSPFAVPAGDVQVAVGAEYRRETINADSDRVAEVGSLLTNNLVQFKGGYNVKEGFLEVGVPVVKDLPFAKSLDLNAAARRTDYELSGPVTTWKAGFTWEPIDSLRARFTRSRDIRAPNLFEIFLVGGQGNATAINRIPNGVVGRNGSVNVNPLGTANTANQGIIQVGSGGGINPDGSGRLNPEIGDTSTGGLVFQKGGFLASLDYYQVKLAGAINRPSNQQAIDICRDNAAASTCKDILFDSTVPGGIKLVETRSTNLDTLTVSGYDFEVAYRTPMLFGLNGNLTLRALVNYAQHIKAFTPLTGLTTENVNTVNSQPKLGYNLTVGYEVERFDFNLQVRGFGKRRGNPLIYNPDGSLSGNTILGPEDAGYAARFNTSTNDNTINQNRFAGQFLVNPSLSVKINDKISVFGNIDNLFDANPPALSTSNVYDLIGRRYRVGVRASL